MTFKSILFFNWWYTALQAYIKRMFRCCGVVFDGIVNGSGTWRKYSGNIPKPYSTRNRAGNIEGKPSISRRGMYVKCRLACVVKNCFYGRSFTKSDHAIIRSYWEKVSANIGEDVFTVTNPGFCTTCLFQIFVIILVADLSCKSLLQTLAANLCLMQASWTFSLRDRW